MQRLVTILLQMLWSSAVAYLFWAAILLSLGARNAFVIVFWPVAVLLSLLHFSAFVLPPVIASLGSMYAVLASARRHGLRYAVWWPLAGNMLFAVCFFGFAETYRSALMHGQALGISPDTMHVHTLVRSLATYGEHAPAHAELTKDGVNYIWSYSELAFLPVLER